MKINQVVENIDQNSGGTATYIQELSNPLLKQNIDLTISTLLTKNPLDFSKKVDLKYFEKSNIKNNFAFDLFHINGLWKLFIHKMILLAKRNKTPYIVSPHGMLEDWSLSQGKLKKKIALLLYQNKDLSNAACIHVTSHSEMENVRKLGFNNPVAIIPNGINIANFPETRPEKNNKIKTLLFLSRIHPKKGIEFLIEAWDKLDHPKKKSWRIEIIGNGSEKYIYELRQKILLKKLSENIKILPPIFEIDKKVDIFRKADVFVLPTFSENFGIVIAESLASYTPVITTKGAPWKDLKDNNCGWWIDIGVDPLTKVLFEVLDSEKEVLIQMGENGRKLIEEKYSIDMVAKNTSKMYNWVVNKKSKPKFIYLNK